MSLRAVAVGLGLAYFVDVSQVSVLVHGSRFCSMGGLQLGSSQVQTEASRARVGNGTKGRAILEAGQAVMNVAARV